LNKKLKCDAKSVKERSAHRAEGKRQSSRAYYHRKKLKHYGEKADAICGVRELTIDLR
jgi:hypothetical protein